MMEAAVQQLKREAGRGLLVGGVRLPLALAELGLSIAAGKRSILAGEKGPVLWLCSGLLQAQIAGAVAAGYFSAGLSSEPFVFGAR
jgi:hypothetical protein